MEGRDISNAVVQQWLRVVWKGLELEYLEDGLNTLLVRELHREVESVILAPTAVPPDALGERHHH